MQSYQQAHLDAVKQESIIDRLNAILTYIEFFKSSMTDNELLTAIQDQMNKHTITKQSITAYHGLYRLRLSLTPGPVTLASGKLYRILTDLENKCKHDLTNKQQ